MNSVQNLIRPLVRALPLLLAAGLLAGCMTPTPYAPRTEGQQTGYTDRALTQTRYRVTFTGNTVTPRDTVESFLLLRAAEVTRAAGYGAFMFDTRNTKANHSYDAIPAGPIGPYGGGGFGFRRGFGGWGGWGFAYDPAVDVVVRTNYEAYAEIVLLTPDQAAKEPRAINAADVISHVGPDAAAPPKPSQT